MKIKKLSAVLLAILLMICVKKTQAQDEQVDTIYQSFVKTDYANVIIGVQKLSEKIPYEERKGFYAIAIVVYDTTFDSNGNPISVKASDYIVHMNKAYYESYVKLKGLCYIHAKWTIKRFRFYHGTTAPKNLSRPGKKILQVYAFGNVVEVPVTEKSKNSETKSRKQVVIKKSDSENQNTESENDNIIKEEVSKKVERNPCPRTDADCAKLRKRLNPKTCNCE